MSKKKDQIFSIAPFDKLSKDGQSFLLENIEIISFNIGEQLIDEKVIPGRVLIIFEGYARSLFRDNGKLKNFKKYEFGTIIGAASIISGQPCENFTAGEGLVAFSIEEEFWEKLYDLDEKFKKWCDINLWVQEILYLLTQKVEIFPKEVEISYEAVEGIFNESKIIIPTQENFLKEIKSGNYIFNLAYSGEKYSLTNPILRFESILNKINYRPRLLSIPKSLFDGYFSDLNKKNISKKIIFIKIQIYPNKILSNLQEV